MRQFITTLAVAIAGVTVSCLPMPMPALGRTIWMRGRTNDGAMLYLDTISEPVYTRGWTIFFYGIKRGDVTEDKIGITPHCYQGKVKYNPSVSNGYNLPYPVWATTEQMMFLRDFTGDASSVSFPGWITNKNGEYFYVKADSPVSLSLLNVVCSQL
ncbi:hypothetical protein NIES4106_61480 (plasmid) [Fischerella sp. NIES-4106]|nr:hypothetical protein NIES4106_61480 [Fischerella sp. NIES-4106]